MPEEQQSIAGAPYADLGRRHTEPPRFCVTCRWYEAHAANLDNPDIAMCNAPQAQRPPLVDMVSGEVTPQRAWCSAQRSMGVPVTIDAAFNVSVAQRFCGREGLWWEPKDAPA